MLEKDSLQDADRFLWFFASLSICSLPCALVPHGTPRPKKASSVDHQSNDAGPVGDWGNLTQV